jgi:hypothetical protein
MTETAKQPKESVISTCPLYEKEFSGYCEGCNQRVDCMLLALLRKVEHIETKIENLSPRKII